VSPVIPPAGAIPPASGGEWSVGGIGGAPGAGQAGATEESGPGFGSMLGEAISGLQAKQEAAATQATELATGQAEDITAVVSAVEEASLSMQLAAQLRNKAVEAYTEIFRTQI
jgi:flagellar hook-basal body complex protein FliE